MIGLGSAGILSRMGTARTLALTLALAGLGALPATAGAAAGDFGPPQSIPGPASFLRAIATADLDGDGGRDDLIVLAGGLTTYLGDGSGGLAATGPAVSSAGASLAVGDVDGDGDQDVVTGGRSPDWNVVLHRNDGHGALGAGAVITPGWSTSYEVDLGDVDGDGDLDLAIGDRLNNVARVWRNDGHGTFTSTGNTAQVGGSNDAESMRLVDVDRDGRLDLLASGGTMVSVAFGRGNGTFLPVLPQAGGNGFNESEAADLDGDGDLDVIVAAYLTADRSTVFQRDGTWILTPRTVTAPAAFWLRIGDLNLDGDPDVLLSGGSHDPDPAVVWLPGGDGTSFGAFRPLATSNDANGTDAALADFDGDGALDVVYVNEATIATRLNQPRAALESAVGDPDAALRDGATVTVPITVHNAGPDRATGSTVTLAAAGADLLDVAPTQGACNGSGPATCTLHTIAAGATVTVSARLRAHAPGPVTVTALATTTTLGSGAAAQTSRSLALTAEPTPPTAPGPPTDPPADAPAGPSTAPTSTTPAPAAKPRRCPTVRTVRVKVRRGTHLRGVRLRSGTRRLPAKRVKLVKRGLRVDLRGQTKRTVKLRVRLVRGHHTRTLARTFKPCR